ncbi:putative glycoside hydrolase [Thermogutta sp.]|uniref:putative glycoside hydrolase n=1 Tax=Thermogutta sp. TaxID=1962930 RepID=UPI003C7E00CB
MRHPSLLGTVSTTVIAVVCLAGSFDAEDPVKLTGFSWDRVPVCIHFGKRTSDLTDAELDFLASHADLITLEKGHGAAVYGSTEAGIAETARRLKQRNPKLKVLFYFNAFINWPGYAAFKTYRDEWTLRDRNGNIVYRTDHVSRPDPSQAAFREWWSNVVADELKRAPLDGVFVDALPQALVPSLARTVGKEKADAIVAGLREMVALTKHKIGEDKIVLANGTRGTDFREILDWEGIDGVMIEHFGAFNSASPEDILADMETMAIAAQKGKFVVLKAWPGFTWLDTAMMSRPYEELLELARRNITFPLACFLVAARPGSFFCYSWGYSDRHGTLDVYSELERPLGPPLGEAQRSGWTFRREFIHASVFVDVKTKTARIEWR